MDRVYLPRRQSWPEQKSWLTDGSQVMTADTVIGSYRLRTRVCESSHERAKQTIVSCLYDLRGCRAAADDAYPCQDCSIDSKY